MFVKPCPKCGRQPKIEDITWNGKKRYACHCPKLCSVIPRIFTKTYTFGFIYNGDCDNNFIFKYWNKAIEIYENNKNKPWYEQIFGEWSDKNITFY